MNSIVSEVNQREILRVTEVLELLQVSRGTLWSMMKTKGLPFSKRGRLLFFDKNAVTAWALSNSNFQQENKAA